MTNEQALQMLANAERYIWSLIPTQHFPSEHPVEYAAIDSLWCAQRDVRIAARKERAAVQS